MTTARTCIECGTTTLWWCDECDGTVCFWCMWTHDHPQPNENT